MECSFGEKDGKTATGGYGQITQHQAKQQKFQQIPCKFVKVFDRNSHYNAKDRIVTFIIPNEIMIDNVIINPYKLSEPVFTNTKVYVRHSLEIDP